MPDDPLHRGDRAVEFLTELWRGFRHGDREGNLARLACLLFAAGPFLPRVSVFWPDPGSASAAKATLGWLSAGCMVAGVVLLGLAFRRIGQRVLAPMPVGKEEPRPAAIKGIDPFGREDGRRFVRLGRDHELGRLRGWIVNDQVDLVAVRAERWGGKTSFLEAGLSHALDTEEVDLFYWDAAADETETRLIEALRQQWNDSGKNQDPLPKDIKDFVEARYTRPKVIVIDRFDVLSPERHPRIFDALRQAARRPSSGKVWVVAFEPEYWAAVWDDFQADLPPERCEQLLLPRFPLAIARQVSSHLIEEAELQVGDRVVEEYLTAVAGDDGTVAPVDVGIGLLAIHRMARARGFRFIALSEFRHGTVPGALLRHYLDEVLQGFPREEELLKALLLLADLDRDAPVAAGRTLEELVQAVSPVNAQRFRRSFRQLTTVPRLLRTLPPAAGGEPRYELAGPLLVPALRLKGEVALGELAEARKIFDQRFDLWTRDNRRVRNLLSLRELSRIWSWKASLDLESDPQRRDFVQRSWRRLNWMAGRILLGIVAVAWGAGFLAALLHRVRLESWNLPRDIYDQQGQLQALTLNESVNRLDWLQEGLRRLDVSKTSIRHLDGLPESIERLNISYTRVGDLAGLPPKLEALDMRWIGEFHARSLPPSFEWEDLPRSLQTLAIAGGTIRDLEGLPAGLIRLSVEDSNVESAAGVPPSVRFLTLSGASFKSLSGLPPGLQSLTLLGTSVTSLREVPDGVSTLVLEKNPALSLDDFPRGVTSLKLQQPGRVDIAALPRTIVSLSLVNAAVRAGERWPESLTKLELIDSEIESLKGLPSTLDFLIVRGELPDELPRRIRRLILLTDQKIDPAILPPTLTHLKLGWQGIDSLSSLPRTLVVLDLSESEVPTLQGLPPGLQGLDFRWSEAVSLFGFHQGMTKLNLQGSKKLQTLEGMPDSLTVLSIRQSQISTLPDLPPGLEYLDLSSTPISELPELPPGLKALTLAPGQIKRLGPLPPALREIRFLDGDD